MKGKRMKSLGALRVYQPTEFEDNIIFLSLQSLSVNDKFLNLIQALYRLTCIKFSKSNIIIMIQGLTMFVFHYTFLCMFCSKKQIFPRFSDFAGL